MPWVRKALFSQLIHEMRILTDLVYRVIEALSVQTISFALLAKLFQGAPNLSKNVSTMALEAS